MLFLLDTNREQFETAPAELGVETSCVGQLLTPLTRFADYGCVFAIDNGAFSGFDVNLWTLLLARRKAVRERCLFVCAPDIVGNARRTLELFRWFYPKLNGWKKALVAQDGLEELDVPWQLVDALFIGGKDTENPDRQWKLSSHARDLCLTAKAMGKHVHMGRVNNWERLDRILEWGCVDSIDGSGISRFSHMRTKIRDRENLFAA